jgi:hypothetical protein
LQLAGIVGPPIGGAMYTSWAFAPVVVLIAMYFGLATVVYFAFRAFVVPAIILKEGQAAEAKPKVE